jgi:predicted phosphodiesterase
MRVAVLSDVHGNVEALEAVLADAAAAEVTAYWLLGDLAAYGPRPAEVVDRVGRLPGLRCVRGNTDRYVVTGEVRGMVPPIDDPRTDEERRLLAEVLESLAWTRRALVDAGQEPWLRNRPVEERLTLPDGTSVLLVHASPGRDDGPGAQPGAGDEQYAHLGFTREVADLFLVGHTHLALDRRLDGAHIVNPGSVSLPRSRDSLARWALLTATDHGYDAELRHTTYDVERVVEDLQQVQHPSAAWAATKLTAEPS